MKLIGYLRVSTDRQAEDGFGLAVQTQQIRRWARESGHRVIRFESDAGVRGATYFAEREGLTAALQAVCQNEAGGVVVAKLDRLARSLTAQEAALAHAWRCGGKVFSVDTGEVLQDDPDDPMRTAMRQMVGVFAELERRMINKRLRDGQRHKAELGGYAGGQPPFGFSAEDGVLVKVSTEQAALARISELRNNGLSFRQIAAALDAEGFGPRGGGRWAPRTLSGIAKRSYLAGVS
jgi:DNA invertase Pin-like site-specific DNA recombinase